MHPKCTILMQSSQNYPGKTPGHTSAGGGDLPPPTLPHSALRASVKPSASLFTCGPFGSGGSGSAPVFPVIHLLSMMNTAYLQKMRYAILANGVLHVPRYQGMDRLAYIVCSSHNVRFPIFKL